jgi:hypothetical protein
MKRWWKWQKKKSKPNDLGNWRTQNHLHCQPCFHTKNKCHAIDFWQKQKDIIHRTSCFRQNNASHEGIRLKICPMGKKWQCTNVVKFYDLEKHWPWFTNYAISESSVTRHNKWAIRCHWTEPHNGQVRFHVLVTCECANGPIWAFSQYHCSRVVPI